MTIMSLDSNKYSQAKIYKIVPKYSNEDMCYIGSTTGTLSRRFSVHKSFYKQKKGGYTVFKIFDKYGVDNCDIRLIENYPCESNQQMLQRETTHIKDTSHCVNTLIPFRTEQEKNENMKDYQNEYRAKKLQQLREYDRLRSDRHKTPEAKEYHKKYNEKWYEQNKAKYTSNIQCECGQKHSFYDRKKHQKTKVHKDWENQQLFSWMQEWSLN